MTERQTVQLEKLGEEWATAESSGDTGYLGRILADDFVAIGPRGFMLTKEQWLSRHISGSLKYESFEWDEVRVRVRGDAAVVTGRETAQGRYEDRDVRHDIQERFRVTLVFVKEQERWLLFSLHLSPITDRPRAERSPGGSQPETWP